MFRTINEQIQVHYCDFVNSQTMKGFSDKNQARVIQRPIIMNGHVGDAVTGYFNLTLIDKRSKEHSIQSERKRNSKGKPLYSSEQ